MDKGLAGGSFYYTKLVVFLLCAGIGFGLVTACQSAPDAQRAVESTIGPPDGVERVEPVDIPGDMDFTDPRFNRLWTTLPRNGTPVFFAAVPRMGNRDREYEALLDHVAARASMFQEVDVSARFLTTTDGFRMGYIEAFDVRYNQVAAARLRDELEVLEHYRDRSGSYVLITVPGLSMVNVPLDTSMRDGLPAWVIDIPEVPGYHVALGVIQRRMFVSESITAADEAATVSLARQTNIQTTRQRMDIETTRTARFREAAVERTEARLHGFYVVARYRSPDGNYYYSLAVARR